MRRLLGLAIVLSLFWPTVGNGTTVLFVPLSQLVQTADLIIYGTVEDSTTKNLADGAPPQIVTDVTLSVSRTLKGQTPGPRFVLRQIGGTYGGYILNIPGQPTLRPGDEVVLFLERSEEYWAISGFAQGMFDVYRDAHGTKIARRSLKGSPVHAFGEMGEQMETERVMEMPLDELFDFIRSYR